MILKNATSLFYNSRYAKEAWLNGTLVWPPYTVCYNWTKTPLASNFWSDLVYGPENTLVATGMNSYSYSLDNGGSWSTPVVINSDPGNEYYSAIAYGSNRWAMVEYDLTNAESKYFYTTVDLLTGWTQIPFVNTTLNPLISTFAYTDGFFNPYSNKFIFFLDQRALPGNNCNSAVVYSDDGVTWLSGGYFNNNGTRNTSPYGFAHGTFGTNMPNNRAVACSTAGEHKFGYSNDGGLTWIKGQYNPGPTGQNLQVGFAGSQVAYGYDNSLYLPPSGRFVVCNGSGTNTYQFAYSDDGIGWIGVSYTTPNLKRNWKSITYANGKFVALSESGGYQAVSVNGVHWTACQNMPSNISYTDITPANQRFVAVVNNEVGNFNAVVTDFN